MEILGTVLGVAVVCVCVCVHSHSSCASRGRLGILDALLTPASKARLDMLHAPLGVMVLGPSEVHVG